MFEKSLYDLIRGLRSHKGNEAEYIQSVLKECRTEVKSQDMDVKATALLKLVYLEMFGHEMSWASFHVLEVMSSNKPLQKRVGYLGAAQTFRSHTEVLMLATNLMKKDLTSVSLPIMSLPLITLPHVITPSLAMSLLSDILPRLSHSQPSIRKKTVVTLYRIALVYPETLRVAWPKMKERLLDTEEDSSVTAAVVNVICELGWRRPQDFLPLAPRLFELLMDDGNNWMLIKIIKLFANLTPLEPRLVKKLVRPLTNLIQTTEAMSLLYECINGIVQGGILNVADSAGEGDELATLCLNKLRGMIVLENDPNLKYVALLAFNQIVVSHPTLVSAQQDVIMGCLDDPDISIRLQALQLVSGMVSSGNLESIVDRLMKQLQSSPTRPVEVEEPVVSSPIEPRADFEGEDPEEKLVEDQRPSEAPPLPNDYRHEVISRILSMCAKDVYSQVSDFEWYIEILVSLVRLLPPNSGHDQNSNGLPMGLARQTSLAEQIGYQLRDIAVRVQEFRPEACRAAETLVLLSNRETLFPSVAAGSSLVLDPCSWICGEYCDSLASPWETLNSLMHDSCLDLPSQVLNSYLQAIPKVFLRTLRLTQDEWNVSRKASTSLLINRLVAFLEKLAAHPNLDVQEMAVEYIELFRLAQEALLSQEADETPPVFLLSALPDLFTGADLNPVAPGAQKKVTPPDELDLTALINPNLPYLLNSSEIGLDNVSAHDDFQSFYYQREETAPTPILSAQKAVDRGYSDQLSYQAADDPELIATRRVVKRRQNRDDPFYIAPENGASRDTSPFQVLRTDNGEDLDIDSIPIVDLQLGRGTKDDSTQTGLSTKTKRSKPRRKVKIAGDDNFDSSAPNSGHNSAPMSLEGGHAFPTKKSTAASRGILHVDSSGLHKLSLVEGVGESQLDFERREAEDAEMAAALKEVEQMRLEMQRAADRIEAAEGVDLEGTVVKKKKKKKQKAAETGADETGEGGVVEVKKKKKKKKATIEPSGPAI